MIPIYVERETIESTIRKLKLFHILSPLRISLSRQSFIAEVQIPAKIHVDVQVEKKYLSTCVITLLSVVNCRLSGNIYQHDCLLYFKQFSIHVQRCLIYKSSAIFHIRRHATTCLTTNIKIISTTSYNTIPHLRTAFKRIPNSVYLTYSTQGIAKHQIPLTNPSHSRQDGKHSISIGQRSTQNLRNSRGSRKLPCTYNESRLCPSLFEETLRYEMRVVKHADPWNKNS